MDLSQLSQRYQRVGERDADPAVQALTTIYGDGVTTAAAALKALNLAFGEGVMAFGAPTGKFFTGTLDMGGGFVLDLTGTMQISPSGDIFIIGNGRGGGRALATARRYCGSLPV